MDYHSLPYRNFIYISLVDFCLDVSSRSVCEAEQRAGSNRTEGLTAPCVHSQNGSVDRGLDGALSDSFLYNFYATLGGCYISIGTRRVFLQRRRGKQFLGSSGGLQVGIGDVAITDSLIISRPGDLLLLVKSSLHFQTGLGFFVCRPGRRRFVAGNFPLFFTRATHKPGLCLPRCIGFREGGLQACLELIAGDLTQQRSSFHQLALFHVHRL